MNQQMSWYQGISHWLYQIWKAATDPSSEVREVGERRQAQLLAALSLLLSAASLLGVLGSLSAGRAFDFGMYVQIPLVGAAIISYGFSRSRNFQAGSWVLVIGVTLIGFADAVYSEQPLQSILLYSSLAFLIAIGLFSWQGIAIYSALGMGMALALPMFSSNIGASISGTIFGQIMTYGLLGMAVVASRNAAEKDRIKEVLKSSEELQHLSTSLEQRVGERTRDIALAAEIGRRITMVRDLGSLLSQSVELIRERFHLYYTQVYLIDARGQSLAIRAGTGRVGEEMLRRSHRLALDLTSINGTAAVERRAVVVEDTSHSLLFRGHPLLPETRSEIAIPLIAGDRVLGVLDLQSSTGGALTSEDLPAFETLAGQLATALLNAELFDQVQRSLVEVETKTRQATRQGWDDFLNAVDEKERLAYTFEAGITAPLTTPLATSADPCTLTAAIKVTGEPVGVLQLDADQPWSKDAVQMVNVVAAQLAQQVENLRLLSQAERYRNEAQQALRRQTREDWQSYIQQSESSELAFQYSGDQVKVLEHGSNGHNGGLSLDIKVQDETIGQFGLAGFEELVPEDMELVNTISAQLSAHLENMRLYTTAQRELEERRRTEQVVESQRRSLQAVLENMPAGVFMVEAPSGKPILSNRAAEDLLGRGISPNAIGEDLNQVYQAFKLGTDELYSPQDMPVVAGMSGLSKSIDDMEVRKPDGSKVLLQVKGAPIFDATGNIVASVAVFQDITEKQQAQEVLESQRRTLQAVLDNMPAGVFMVEAPSGRPILTNKRAEEFLGRGISPDAIGDDLNQIYQAYRYGTEELYPPAEMPVVAGLMGQAKTISDMEVRKPDGSRVLLEINGAPVFDNNGEISASVVVFTDISERRRLEDTILQERTHLAEALDIARMANWEFDLNTGNFIFNDRFYEFLGTTVEAEGGYEMSAQEYATRFVHPDDVAEVAANVPLAIATTDPHYTYEGLSKQVLANGEVRDVIVRFSIEKDEQGRTVRLFGANQDVTEQRRQEDIIAKRAAELATVSQVSTAVATILSPDDMLQTVVDLTKASFGLYHAHVYLLNEAGDTLVLAKGAGEVGRQMVSEGRQIALNAERSLVARAVRMKEGVIVNDVRQDPDFLPHPLLPETRAEMAVPMLVGERVIGVLDVQSLVVNRFTDEDVMIKTTLASQVAIALQNARQYEQAQASEQLIRSVIDATPDWIFIKDQQHRYRLVNQGYANSLHIDLESFIGKDDLELGFPEELVKGNPEKGITGFWADDRAVMDSGEVKVYPNDLVVIDGQLRTLNTIKTPLRDNNGQVTGILAFGRDVTERETLLKDTEVLYSVTSRLSRSRTQKEVLDAVVEGTIMNTFDSASIYFFDRPWKDDVMPQVVITEAIWERIPGSFPVRLGQPLPIQALPGIDNLINAPYFFVEDARTHEDLHEMVRQMLVQAGMISSLNLRLLVGGEWVGCISATSSEPKTLTELDVRRLLTLVDQATTVIYGLLQYQATQAHARREQTLREITARVRSSMDPEAILRTAVRELGTALGRQTFIRLGSAEQLEKKPGSDDGHAGNGNGSTSVTGEGGN